MNNLTGLGLRINSSWTRPDGEYVQRLGRLPVAVIGDIANRLQAFPAGFTAYGGRKKFAGSAFTVRVRPGDNLFLHKALEMAQPGDVLVVDAGGATNSAILGAMMSSYARSRGIEAIVVDGAIRDVEELEAMDFAVVARGATPNGPFKSGPGEIGYSIGVGGLSIAPGDLLVGDRDGVLVVPRDQVTSVTERAEALHERERIWEREIQAGSWNRTWIDEMLRKL